MASYSRPIPPPPEVIIYRHQDKLVYVKPPMDYDEAIDLAIQEFPTLRNTSGTLSTSIGEEKEAIALKALKERITFMTTMNDAQQSVSISKSAWKPCVSRMRRAEVVTIVVVDPHTKETPKIDPPPQYHEVREHTAHHKSLQSTPSSRSSSPRQRTPSGSSRPPRRSWFQKY